jgi:hypothetical protein
MEKFDLGQISLVDDKLVIYCTDSSVLTKVRILLDKFFPTTTMVEPYGKLPIGGSFCLLFLKMKQNYSAEWLVMHELCQQGWEPFSYSAGDYSFRRISKQP